MSAREKDFRLIKADENKKSSAEKSSLQSSECAILPADELRRRYLKLRRAFLAFEQLMVEQGLDLKSE